MRKRVMRRGRRGPVLWAPALVLGLICGTAAGMGTAGAGGLDVKSPAGVPGLASMRGAGVPLPTWTGLQELGTAPAPLALRSLGVAGAGARAREARGASGNASAILTGLLSAAVPGAGQLRNGSLLRGIGYFAAELGGWMAYLSFRQGSEDRLRAIAGAAEDDWSYDRYASRATLPDSCAACGCPDGERFAIDSDAIAAAQEQNRQRFLEYVTRPAYGCGWDTELSRSIYLELWQDREDLQNAQRWSGRLIFLNHIVSAVDAFLEARSVRMAVGDHSEIKLHLRGRPGALHPELRIVRRF